NGTGALSNGSFRDTAKFKQGSRTYTYQQLKQGYPDEAVARPYKIKKDGSLSKVPSYKNYSYYHAYTKAQLATLKKVLNQIKSEYPNISIGSQYSGANGFYEQFPNKKSVASTAFKFNQGIYTHNSYRTDKSDVFPQKELIELLKEFN
ncbi:MAG: hypothetical protein K0U52_13220, partial [Gammaproteobacteria bacterium]|nr:hypothetical protein [Gammaproteobacteria bacterium]